MVVDGSEVSRTIIARILDREMPATRIIACGSAAEARAHLEVGTFDLVTTALMLPDQDGLELARQIRQSSAHHYTPVVVVSGDADGRLLREGFDAGVTDYFDKALGHRAFVEFVKTFTRRHRGLVGKILYVEDSRTAAMVTCHVMEKHGLKITHTTSAEQALELLEQTAPGTGREDEGFDIVITDFYLNGRLTGGDLLYAIRTRLHYSQQEMPVLVVTMAENDERQAEVFHAGANDFVTKPIVEEVLLARIRSLLLIKQQFNALKTQAEEMQRIAATDSLTGVRSKRFLLDHGDKLLMEADNLPVCGMLLDIDHFKQINDTQGHITGDHVLAALGDLLNRSLPDEALIVRFGGEEFAVLLPRCGGGSGYARAEALRRAIANEQPAGIPVTVSVGMACTETVDEPGLNRLLALADQALYRAKDGGRNRVCVHEMGGALLPAAAAGPVLKDSPFREGSV